MWHGWASQNSNGHLIVHGKRMLILDEGHAHHKLLVCEFGHGRLSCDVYGLLSVHVDCM